MTTKQSLLTTVAFLLVLACTKEQTKDKPKGLPNADLIAEAQRYFAQTIGATGQAPFTGNYRARQAKTLLWDSAIVQHFSDGDEVTVPVFYGHNLYVSSQSATGRIYRLDDLTSLVFSRNSTGHFSSAVVTFIPDSTNSQNAPHGTWFVEDWQGNTLQPPVQN